MGNTIRNVKGFMRRSFVYLTFTSLLILVAAGPSTQPTPRDIYQVTAKSLVIVQYTWAFELGDRRVRTAGIIMDRNGTVMLSASAVDDRVPQSQIKDVKILLPRHGVEPLEVEADYVGRNDRTHLAFVKARRAVDWSPLSFSPDTLEVGDTFYSVGLMTEGTNGFKPYLMQGTVSAIIPGERTQVLSDGHLAQTGSPVLNIAGKAIGFVDVPPNIIHNSENGESGPAQSPSVFTPSSDFIESLAHTGKPDSVPWFGVFDMVGLSQDSKSYYGLTGPALQLSSIASGSPAESSGLKQGDIITSIDGHPLESGDTPDDVPALFRRRVARYNPDQTIDLTVLKERGKALVSVHVKLTTTPSRPNTMARSWSDNLKLGVRDVCFLDRYFQHMSPTDAGVIVAVLKPDGPAAAAHVPLGSLVLNVNGAPVSDVAEFQRDVDKSRTTAPQDAVLLLIRASGQEQTIRIEPGR